MCACASSKDKVCLRAAVRSMTVYTLRTTFREILKASGATEGREPTIRQRVVLLFGPLDIIPAGDFVCYGPEEWNAWCRMAAAAMLPEDR